MKIWRLRIEWDECYECGHRRLSIRWRKPYIEKASQSQIDAMFERTQKLYEKDIAEFSGISPFFLGCRGGSTATEAQHIKNNVVDIPINYGK